ncbi:hypothetical protein [Haloglomus litoreum]|uniref:hypothetical protein n=1 Tax=Haloglomus litoreum TaxID=3034026 RepID=UPI0023E78338|nr:hypothetical protein [Haloglomus sp. DT116]
MNGSRVVDVACPPGLVLATLGAGPGFCETGALPSEIDDGTTATIELSELDAA